MGSCGRLEADASAVEGAEFIPVDLLDARKCEEVFSRMADVTHVAYAAVNEKPDLLEGWLERKQMEVNLGDAAQPLRAVTQSREKSQAGDRASRYQSVRSSHRSGAGSRAGAGATPSA